jgi:hypothetical protein
MSFPTIETTGRDEDSGVTYIVVAYRALTPEELQQTVLQYLRRTRKKPKSGTTVRIHSLIGLD